MNPRLKSSKKSTAFPKEYTKQIQGLFNENFAQYLENAKILVEGRIYPEEILLRVGYTRNGQLAQANFEVSVGYSSEKQDTLERIHNCVDAAASMLLEYFEAHKSDDEDAELDLPYLWTEIPFDGFTAYFQFTTENTELEAEANRLLGIAEGELLLDEEDDEDALSRAEVQENVQYKHQEHDHEHDHDVDHAEEALDDNEADKGPQMFGGKKKKKGELH